MSEPITVGGKDDVPEGEIRQYQVGGEDVAVANVAGELHAFSDVCTHAQCSLAEGDLEGTTVTCMCHGSQFDVTTGDVLNGPAVDPVQSYQVVIEGDDLKIGL
jgi:nitrite reductase/ring-hydroxylating ferredoxin subunit